MLAAQGVQQRVPGGQEGLQGAAVGAFQQHLCALDVGHALHRQRYGRVHKHIALAWQLCLLRGLAGGLQEGLRGLLAAGIGAHQRLVGEGGHGGAAALVQLLRGKGRVVVAAQRGKQGVLGVVGLQPHFRAAALRGHVLRIAPGAPGGLQQQGKQALGGAKVAGKQLSVGLHCGHQGDAAKVVPLGHHLRAHQHINFTRVDLLQLRFQRPFGAGGVGVNTHHPHGPPSRGDDVAQQVL